jgi:signal peptidase I
MNISSFFSEFPTETLGLVTDGLRGMSRWLISRTVRQATDMRKQVWIVLNSQRDVLSPKAINEVTRALAAFRASLKAAPDAETLLAEMEKLEKTATQWLKPYPHPSARENFKEFLVSAVLVLAIFNFFLQPMKIPSGSAQPTLYGNVIVDLKMQPDFEIPPLWRRFIDWFKGIDYHLWIAKEDGELEIEPVTTIARVIKRQRFLLGNDSYTFWFPPEHLTDRNCSGVYPGQQFKQGDTILKLRVANGDRLFVDRFTYNFRRPQRGEIIVFVSTGLPHPSIIPNTHYIKRLIGLGGDRIRIGDDRHLIINGERLDASTPHFENVYSFNGPPRDSVYSGHLNEKVAEQFGRRGLASLFPDEDTEFVVRPNHYICFGDNTMNSNDGRNWGDFPREKVIGRACFVFWPITTRFGLVMD